MNSNQKTYKVAILVFNNFLYDSRVLREAISLNKGGYEVKVIAFHEEGLPEFEHKEGIPVYRIKLKSRNWSKNIIVQIFKWIELFYRIIKNHRDADFYHACDVFPLPVGMFIKKFFNKNAKVVYDAHELEFARTVDRKSIGNILGFIESRYIRKVDAMMTVSAPIAEAYAEHYNITPPKVVMNCAYKQDVVPNQVFRKKFKLRKEQKIILYQGMLKHGRGIEQLIEAFKTLPDDYVLVLLGIPSSKDYKENLNKEIAPFKNIFFHLGVPPHELLAYTASADIGAYLTLKINRNHELALGNKLFEYLHAGLPVLSSDLILTRQIVGDKLGCVLDEVTPEDIKKGIYTILENGKSHYQEAIKEAANIYNWENQEKIMLDIYDNLK